MSLFSFHCSPAWGGKKMGFICFSFVGGIGACFCHANSISSAASEDKCFLQRHSAPLGDFSFSSPARFFKPNHVQKVTFC